MNPRNLWKFFTSLRLTVACLAIGILVVFFGTLAQVNEGLYQAQAHWFQGWLVWWTPPATGFFAHWPRLPILPGGYLVGTVLLLNLFAAHVKRFVWGWRKLGIHLTHFGIILLLVGQLTRDMLSRESLMRLREGEGLNYSEDHFKAELIFASDAGNGQNRVVAFDQGVLAKQKEIKQDDLPFAVRVKSFYPNVEMLSRKSVLEAGQTLTTALATVEGEYSSPEGLAVQAERSQETEGRTQVWREALQAVGEPATGDLVAAAKRVAAQPERAAKLCTELKTRFQAQMIDRFKNMPPMLPTAGAMRYAAERIEKHEPVTADSLPNVTDTGVGKGIIMLPQPEAKTDERNMPAAIIELAQGGQAVAEEVVSPYLTPQQVTLDGKHYDTALRFERYYHPFSITLLKMSHDFYRGTDIPRNYQSRVRVDNEQTGEHREVDIYMNNPLRYAGLTFYQYQMTQAEANMGGEETSTLEVVRNPSWLTPYFGCALVAVGMAYQFLYHLRGFVAKRRAPAPLPEKGKGKKSPARLAPAVASAKN